MWQHRGQRRPDFAAEPGPGQESVWDYPRPPAIEPSDRIVEVSSGELEIARTNRAVRVLETASPPTWYIPVADIRMEALVEIGGSSYCEWKGVAHYLALATDPPVPVAWGYAEPTPAFRAIADRLSFYPGRVACFVDGERVQPQPGGFYGGWVTRNIAGPFKGEPGTGHW